MAEPYFNLQTFEFLDSLAANNNRDWFHEHKQDYEMRVRTPAFEFIADVADELAIISPHFLALSKKVGGSLMRVNRDIRFGKDKRPYKTNIGIQFRHEQGKDVHAPGYYLHVERENCFLGVGIWRPDRVALENIRKRIDEKGSVWLKARDNKGFKKRFELSGDTLTNPPRGYAKTHSLLEDIKRKDFIAISEISEATVMSKKLRQTVVDQFSSATPYMKFLCQALALRF